MNTSSAIEQTRLSLNTHAMDKGREIRAKYGPILGWSELQLLLQDRTCVRYPTQILFDASPLLPGEMAFPMPMGERPEDGFCVYIHPLLATQLHQVIYPVLYQLVVINYGPFATPDDAEVFGSSALGISKNAYYQTLCQMADRLYPQSIS